MEMVSPEVDYITSRGDSFECWQGHNRHYSHLYTVSTASSSYFQSRSIARKPVRPCLFSQGLRNDCIYIAA